MRKVTQSESDKRWYRKNRKKKNASHKKWLEENKDKMKAYRSRPDVKFKVAAAMRRFEAKRLGYAECVDYPQLPTDGRCDICSRVVERLNLDHDHETGKFRGYLCLNCNLGLGKFGDNLDNLLRAVAYLERS